MEPAFARIDAELVAFAEKGAELLPAAAEAPPPMPTMRALPGAAAPPPPLASVVRLIKEQEAEVATGRETPLSGEMQIEVQLGRARLAPAGRRRRMSTWCAGCARCSSRRRSRRRAA